MKWLHRPNRFFPGAANGALIILCCLAVWLAMTAMLIFATMPARAQVPFAVPEQSEPRVIRHVYQAPPYAVAPAQPISPYRAEQFRSHGQVIPLEPNMSPYRREQLGLRSDPATASPYRQELWRAGRR